MSHKTVSNSFCFMFWLPKHLYTMHTFKLSHILFLDALKTKILTKEETKRKLKTNILQCKIPRFIKSLIWDNDRQHGYSEGFCLILLLGDASITDGIFRDLASKY